MNVIFHSGLQITTLQQTLDSLTSQFSSVEYQLRTLSDAVNNSGHQLSILSEASNKSEHQLNILFDASNKSENQLSNLSDAFKNSEHQLRNLSDAFNKYEPIFCKAGLTYELVVRREVRELRGVQFARAFHVANLAGLARISSPKEIDNNFKPVKDWNTHILLQQRTNQLAKEAEKSIQALQEIPINCPGVSDRKWYILKSQLEKYNSLKSDTERAVFLETSALGLMGFSCRAFTDSTSFEDILECDVRGESTLRGEMIQITVGEIKSGKERGKALVQLLKRLCIVGHATRVIFGEVVDQGLSLDLQGEVFTPLVNWPQFSEEEVEEGLRANKLIVPPGGRIRVKIIYLS